MLFHDLSFEIGMDLYKLSYFVLVAQMKKNILNLWLQGPKSNVGKVYAPPKGSPKKVFLQHKELGIYIFIFSSVVQQRKSTNSKHIKMQFAYWKLLKPWTFEPMLFYFKKEI